MLADVDVNGPIHAKPGEKIVLVRRFVTRRGENEESDASAATTANARLSFHEIQRRLHRLLMTRVSSAADLARGIGFAVSVERTLDSCMDEADDEATRLLQPLHSRWSRERGSVLLSTRVMDVLRFKRDFFRQGGEASYQDFLDWLQLAASLGEDVERETVEQYAQRLGPVCCEAIAAELATMPASDPTDIVDCAELCARLHARVVPPLQRVSAFTARGFVMAFDELIEMDEQVYTSINSLTKGNLLTGNTRRNICESLFDFSNNYLGSQKLRPETYFLGVALMDRYMAATRASRSHVGVIGCAALLLASKYEEIYGLEVKKILECTNGSLTEGLLLATEQRIFETLDYTVGTATVSHAASALLLEQDPPATREQQDIVRFITTAITLMTPLGEFRQTFLAAAAVHISRRACGLPTGESSDGVRHLIPTVLDALDQCRPKDRPSAVWSTFSSGSYHHASVLNYRDLFPA